MKCFVILTCLEIYIVPVRRCYCDQYSRQKCLVFYDVRKVYMTLVRKLFNASTTFLEVNEARRILLKIKILVFLQCDTTGAALALRLHIQPMQQVIPKRLPCCHSAVPLC